MKKVITLLLAASLITALYAQEEAAEYGSTLTTGRAATLGVEASTTFAWDVENNSTGLETKIGLELIFDLFPSLDRGVAPPDDPDSPYVRMILKDASFAWWNTFSTRGGNYEQDDFNSWQARPLILTFDYFIADLVWKNYFLRVGSSTTIMQVDTVSLRSIFDDVMDVQDRFYYRENQALWRQDRYNIQRFPLLNPRIERNVIDEDYRDEISGILAGGFEFDKFGVTLKAASYANGLENDENAWLFGADIEIVPIENLKFDITGFAGVNYDKTPVGYNPLTFGIMAQYRYDLFEDMILNPYVGFDFTYDEIAEEAGWEFGAGIMFYTRGYDLMSYRVLDFDDVIPVGASLSMNMDQDSKMNLMLSWFDPPGRYSLIENFGGFIQLELSDLTEQDGDMGFGVLGQLEYAINNTVMPYIRGGYKPQMEGSSTTGNYWVTTAVGCYLTPAHFFSLDIIYEMNHLLTSSEFETDQGVVRAIFTIRM